MKIGANARVVINLTVIATGDNTDDDQAIKDAIQKQLGQGISHQEITSIEITDQWEATIPTITQLINGDRQGQIKLTFPKPTTINVRNPKSRQETITTLEGYVFGGWPEADTFLVHIGTDTWDIRQDYNPTITSFEDQ